MSVYIFAYMYILTDNILKVKEVCEILKKDFYGSCNRKYFGQLARRVNFRSGGPQAVLIPENVKRGELRNYRKIRIRQTARIL